MTSNGYMAILRALTEGQVEFIIGGGVACVLHGVERLTMDVDIAAHMTRENLQRFLGIMEALGLTPVAPVPPTVLLDSSLIRQLVTEKNALVFSFVDVRLPYRQLDLFLHQDMDYENLLPDSEWIDLEGLRVRVINRQRLLSIKRSISPPRTKDLLDIEALEKETDSQ